MYLHMAIKIQKWTHHLVHNLQTCPFLFTVFTEWPYICAWKISCATQALLGLNRLILMYFQSIKDPLQIPRAWCSDSLTFKQSYIIVHPENRNVLSDLFSACHSICGPPQWWACFSGVCLLCRGDWTLLSFVGTPCQMSDLPSSV